MVNPVIIFGANHLGKAAYDVLKSNGVEIYAFLDEDKKLHGKSIGEVSILGRSDDDGFLKLIGKKCDAFVAIDEVSIRQSIVEMLNTRRKVMPINVIHSSALISELAELSYGTFLGANSSIGAGSKIKEHGIIHSAVNIDYEAEIDQFVHIGTGSNINSGVKIGKNVFIGSGVTIVSGISIEDSARIGAGSVVVDHVKKGETVFGNPAKSIKS